MITDSKDTVIQHSDYQGENKQLILNEGFDFSRSSLIEAVMLIDAELTGVTVKKIQDELNLQHIVLKSKLADFLLADKAKLEQLIAILYQQQGFRGDWEAFFEVDNALISKVLLRHKGIPISLGVLFLDFLEHCGFTVQGICFPSGFMIRIDLPDEVLYFDPFTGKLPSWYDLELRVRGQLGNYARLTLDMLKPDDNKTIIMRLVNVLKAAYIQADILELALLCSDILLRIDPDDAYEVRDRGFIFQQLDCFKLASTDFEYFIEQCPEDPIVGLLKQQVKQMNIETFTQVIH